MAGGNATQCMPNNDAAIYVRAHTACQVQQLVRGRPANQAPLRPASALARAMRLPNATSNRHALNLPALTFHVEKKWGHNVRKILACWQSNSCIEGPLGASAPSVASAAGDAAALPPPCATGSAPHRPKLRRRGPAELFGVRMPRSIERAPAIAGACEYPGGATAPHGGPGCFGAGSGAQQQLPTSAHLGCTFQIHLQFSDTNIFPPTQHAKMPRVFTLANPKQCSDTLVPGWLRC